MSQYTTQRQTGHRTRMRAPRLRITLAGIGLLMLSSGCATIVSGPTQTIGVASIPAGAQVSINDEVRGQTPLTTPVSRRRNHTVRIEKPGYQPVERTLTRHVNGWVFGNLLIGGILGTGIDAATGAIFEVEPDRIFATLAPQEQPPVAPQEQPPVATQEQPPVAPQEQPPVAPQEQPPVAPQEQPPVAPQRQPLVAPQRLPLVSEQAAPQCMDTTVRAQCPLYQYRTGIYRGRCQDGSRVEVGPDYVKVLPPDMGRQAPPWQADGCHIARPNDAGSPIATVQPPGTAPYATSADLAHALPARADVYR